MAIERKGESLKKTSYKPINLSSQVYFAASDPKQEYPQVREFNFISATSSSRRLSILRSFIDGNNVLIN